jgi:hypothetical protein
MRPLHLWLLLTLPFAFVLLGCRTRSVSDDAAASSLDDAGTADAPFVFADAGSVDAGPTPECRAVDVLFVIDDSASMADQQAALIASFDGFVAGTRERLANALDFHVGVVSTDDYAGNEAGCREIGDLVTQTGGIESSDRACGPFGSGARYLDNLDTQLASRFACIAQLGVGGNDDERVARALLNAIQPDRPCNAGFLRPDALLVVVIITDEDDLRDGCDGSSGFETCQSYGSGGLPDDWFAELSSVRDPASVVVLSLIARRGDNPCGAVPAARILGFTNRFGDNGFLGDVCASSYDEFFTQSLPVIATACENLI